MRLIDAEKCPCNKCGAMYCYKNCKEYDEWLNGTAYDVEAVATYFDKEAQRKKEQSEISTIFLDKEILKYRAEECKKYADIVRNGGKE